MPQLDRHGLEDEFNIADVEQTEDETETVETEIIPEIVEEDETEPDPFELEWEKENEHATGLEKNIERANTILDQVQEELAAGNFEARIIEVAGNLINSITTASKVLIDDTNYNKYLDIRKGLALLKQREVNMKELKSGRPTGNNNLIIASREDVLKLINEKQ